MAFALAAGLAFAFAFGAVFLLLDEAGGGRGFGGDGGLAPSFGAPKNDLMRF